MCVWGSVCKREHEGVCLQVLFALACLFVKMSLISGCKHLWGQAHCFMHSSQMRLTTYVLLRLMVMFFFFYDWSYNLCKRHSFQNLFLFLYIYICKSKILFYLFIFPKLVKPFSKTHCRKHIIIIIIIFNINNNI